MAAPTATASSGLTSLRGSLAKELAHLLLHLGHPGLAADQHHIVDLADAQPGVLQRDPARTDGFIHQVLDQRFQFGAGQFHIEMLRAAGVRRHVRQVDLGLLAGGQLDLGLLGGFLQTLQGQRIVGQVDAALLLELLDQVVDDPHVEVLTAQEGIAVGRQHLELVLAVDFGDLDDGNVESTAAQVVNRDLAVLRAGLVHAVGQRRRRRFVDDAFNVQARRCDRRPWWPDAGCR